uniref:Uncharacterized protein n=1 Tax=Rhizophora mucronata TaxID=61149 RepID=A0A2P2KE13_RHIMU
MFLKWRKNLSFDKAPKSHRLIQHITDKRINKVS